MWTDVAVSRQMRQKMIPGEVIYKCHVLSDGPCKSYFWNRRRWAKLSSQVEVAFRVLNIWTQHAKSHLDIRRNHPDADVRIWFCSSPCCLWLYIWLVVTHLWFYIHKPYYIEHAASHGVVHHLHITLRAWSVMQTSYYSARSELKHFIA